MTDTPECNALESNPLDSFDYRAWMTLAKSLERRLREASPGEAEQREPTLADLERQLKQAEFEKQAYTDALRYRWLRDHGSSLYWTVARWDAALSVWEGSLGHDRLDAAIDAAMSASGETGEGK